MQVQFIKTKTVSDYKYVDLVMVDGKPFTFLMKKDEKESTVISTYVVEEQKEGDYFKEFVEKNIVT